MKTDKEIEEIMDKAETEIGIILKKYDLELSMLYSDGIAVTLRYEQKHPRGDISVFEREAF